MARKGGSRKLAKLERGNGWKNVRPRSQMHAIDKGYQGSEKKKRRPAAKYSFFGGKRWD